MLSKSCRTGTLVLFLSISILLIPASSISPAQEQKKGLGELKIEGSHIERLVLQSRDGQTKSFNNPDEVINLPTGEYYLRQVRLKGGYHGLISTRVSEKDWITVNEDKPIIIKVGAPLEQKIEVMRQGSFLVLEYKLLGIGGNLYRDSGSPDTRPYFTVYKGDKVVGSGKFEYG